MPCGSVHRRSPVPGRTLVPRRHHRTAPARPHRRAGPAAVRAALPHRPDRRRRHRAEDRRRRRTPASFVALDGADADRVAALISTWATPCLDETGPATPGPTTCRLRNRSPSRSPRPASAGSPSWDLRRSTVTARQLHRAGGRPRPARGHTGKQRWCRCTACCDIGGALPPGLGPRGTGRRPGPGGLTGDTRLPPGRRVDANGVSTARFHHIRTSACAHVSSATSRRAVAAKWPSTSPGTCSSSSWRSMSGWRAMNTAIGHRRRSSCPSCHQSPPMGGTW
jgi:hypothetical protein